MELLEQPQMRALLEEGAREGSVSIERINALLGDLDIDALDADELFGALEDRAISVKQAKIRPTTAAGTPAQAQAQAARTAPKRKKNSTDSDLDEVLESLQSLEELM